TRARPQGPVRRKVRAMERTGTRTRTTKPITARARPAVPARPRTRTRSSPGPRQVRSSRKRSTEPFASSNREGGLMGRPFFPLDPAPSGSESGFAECKRIHHSLERTAALLRLHFLHSFDDDALGPGLVWLGPGLTLLPLSFWSTHAGDAKSTIPFLPTLAPHARSSGE